MILSIITVNYNNLDGLKNTRQSIINQSFKDWEWIVIDGGSTLGDKAFIEQHSSEMAYWCSEPDHGPYNAMNKGINKASGDYYIFMNSGDTFFDSDVLTHVFNTPHTADIIYGDWMQLFDNGEKRKMHAPKEFTIEFIQNDNICHQAMFIKGSIMKQSPYDESFRLYADWAKWIRLALQGCTFEYVPYTICCFLMNGISITQHELIEKEHRRLNDEVMPALVTSMISRHQNTISKQEQTIAQLTGELASINKWALEADRLIKKKKLYKKIIHMAIRIIHLIDK